MLINNRDIVLQGSGTINGGSGTPLSVPLPSGSSFMPKIDLKYMLEKVNNLVYPYSSTDSFIYSDGAYSCAELCVWF